jgi:hypothetical protein
MVVQQRVGDVALKRNVGVFRAEFFDDPAVAVFDAVTSSGSR